MGISKRLGMLIFIHCLFPLLIGGFTYLFFRPTLFLNVTKIAVQQPWLKQLIYTLPDYCWSYSLASALYLFSIASLYSFKISVILIGILIIASEVIQLVFQRYFTFDVYDLMFSFFAFILSTLQMQKIAYESKA